jgi:hypothetical protein
MGFIRRYNNLKKNNMANDIGWGEGACNNDIGWGIAQEYFSCSGSGEAPVGATLMKTGQTTSYRTGDDGDLEAGRATDFTTLESNNPFGNTNRFTDELGGTTYTNRIRIDWSTYNGTTVLGYYQLASPLLQTWAQAIDWGLALSIGTFTSGWKLPNINELMNLMNWSLSANLNYSPFSIATLSHWSSTTNNNDTASSVIVLSNSTNPVLNYTKTLQRNTYFAVRVFTVSGTTLS